MIGIPENTHLSEAVAEEIADKAKPDYLHTKEAAAYLRKSELWLLRRPDIPYLKGRPNLYKKSDLDHWFQRNKYEPRVK